MKVAYYLHPSNLKAGGIFTYSIGILKILIDEPLIEDIFIFYTKNQSKYLINFKLNKKVKLVLIDRDKLRNKVLFYFAIFLLDIYTIYSGYFENKQKLKLLLRVSASINPYNRKLKKLNVDIFHSPVLFLPVYNLNIPIITTLHDLQEIHYPEFFSAHERLHRNINSKKLIEGSSHIIVSFSHIKNDVLKYFEIGENRVSICPPPFAEEWFSKDTFTTKDELIKKFSLPDQFILYPAATWKHKNHAALIEAVSVLRKKGIDISLLCTGNKTEFYTQLKKQADDLSISDYVKFLGIVDEEDLIGLFKLAGAVVIPTLYEAGSGPMYEAMRYGTPVLASNVTSLPDSMGDDRFIFNPKNIQEMSELIERILIDDKFREDNINNSKQRIESFKQYDYAKNFIEVYKKVSNKN